MFRAISVSVILLALCQINLTKHHRNSRITDGRPVKIKEFPYTVSLRHNNSHFCGGAIISKRYIITASQCLMGFVAKDLTVLAGYTWLNATDDKAIKAIEVHRHPKFNGRDYDIGIVTLEKDLIYSEDISEINLPKANETIDSMTKDSLFYVTGWGYRTFNENKYSPRLRAVIVPPNKQDLCKTVMKDVTDRMICSGFHKGGPRDSCIGDTGGPFATWPAPNKLIGVVSWGIGCGIDGNLGVNTRIDDKEIRSFIKEVTGY